MVVRQRKAVVSVRTKSENVQKYVHTYRTWKSIHVETVFWKVAEISCEQIGGGNRFHLFSLTHMQIRRGHYYNEVVIARRPVIRPLFLSFQFSCWAHKSVHLCVCWGEFNEVDLSVRVTATHTNTHTHTYSVHWNENQKKVFSLSSRFSNGHTIHPQVSLRVWWNCQLCRIYICIATHAIESNKRKTKKKRQTIEPNEKRNTKYYTNGCCVFFFFFFFFSLHLNGCHHFYTPNNDNNSNNNTQRIIWMCAHKLRTIFILYL